MKTTNKRKIEITDKGVKFFGSEGEFMKWLLTPNPDYKIKGSYLNCPVDHTWEWREKEIDELIKKKSK